MSHKTKKVSGMNESIFMHLASLTTDVTDGEIMMVMIMMIMMVEMMIQMTH